MSDPENGVELQIMADYDFKAPIDTAIIYYDSDDDNVAKEFQYDFRQQNEIINENPINDVITELTNNGNEPVQDKNIKRKRNSRELEKETKQTKSVPLSKEAHVAEIIIKYPLMTPPSDHDNIQSSSNQALVSKSHNATKTLVELQHTPNNQLSTNNITQEQQIITNNYYNNTATEPIISSCTNNTLPSMHTDNTNRLSNNSLDAQRMDANKLIDSLLMTVSDHVICIMKARIDLYLKISTNSDDRTYINSVTSKYKRIKYHFFNLSFTTIVNLILPKAKDQTFMRSIIDNTYNLAQSKNLNFTYEDILALFNQMLDWVKAHRYPSLNKLLSEKQQSQEPVRSDRSKEHQGWICKNTYGEYVNRLMSHQHFDHAGDDNENIPGNTLQPARDSSIEQQSHLYKRYTANNNITIMSQTQQRHKGSVINTAPITSTQQFQKTNMQQQNLLPSIESFAYQQSSENLSNNYPMVSLPSFAEEYQVFSKKNHHYLIPDDRNISKNNRQPKQIMHSPTTQQSNCSQNPIMSSPNYNSFQIQTQVCDSTRSLSRDSGIMSPLNSMPTSPMITHVTSLNPNATYIQDGLCMVCGKHTKHKCLGCFKTYYCCYQCQFTDWQNHIRICKRT